MTVILARYFLDELRCYNGGIQLRRTFSRKRKIWKLKDTIQG